MSLVRTALVIVCSVLTISGCASSKPDRGEKINQFDSDGDGFLSREEYSASSLSEVVEFESLDADGDDLLSRAELDFQMGRGSRERGPRGQKGRRHSDHRIS